MSLKNSNEIRKILFMRTDRMGDVLMNLPAIRLLRQNYPKAWIAVMLDKSVAPLLRQQPDIDEIIEVDIKKIERNLFYRVSLIGQLKKIRFHAAIISNPHKLLNVLAFWAGIPKRVGYDRKWPFLLTDRVPYKTNGPAKHEIDKNLSLVSSLCPNEKRWDGQFFIGKDELTSHSMRKQLLSQGFLNKKTLLIHTGASNPKKQWAEERFVDLCEKIRLSTDWDVIFIGSAEEAPIVSRLIHQSGIKALDLTGKTNLAELNALTQQNNIQAIFSSDSGPVHIAHINRVPGVILFARDLSGCDPMRWGPRDEKSRVIYKSLSEVNPADVFGLLKEVMQ